MASTSDEAMLCRMTPSHWKTGQVVPTYFVSAKPRKGYYRRLKDALQQVPPFSRVEIVGGGVFHERLLIEKPIEIGVSKATDPPIIVSKSTPLTLNVDEAYIEGVAVEIEAAAPAIASVVVQSGSPVLQWCVLQGLEVVGNSCPTVRECKIADSRVDGILLLEQASGQYVKNSVWGHAGYSIVAASVGEPTFSYNIISDSRLGQVCVKDSEVLDEEGGSGGPTVVAPQFLLNRITDDMQSMKANGAGLALGLDENGVMPSYKLDQLEVKQTGERVTLMPVEKRTGEVEDVDDAYMNDPIIENSSQRCAFLVNGRRAQPVLTRNSITACQQHGLLLRGGCGGVYESNYMATNKGWGVVVLGKHYTSGMSTTMHSPSTTNSICSSEARPCFTGNQICGNGGGVKIGACDSAFTDGNVLIGNRGPQIYVEGGHPSFLFEGNSVNSGNSVGVWCTGVGSGTFSGNTFENCAEAFRIERLADPQCHLNSMEGCGIGVFAHMGARGTFRDCQLSDITRVGVVLSTAAQTCFLRCRLFSCVNGALITRGGRGTFTDCEIVESRLYGMGVSEGGHPMVQQCRITGGRTEGLRVFKSGGGTFSRNLFAGNDGSQIRISQGGDPWLSENVIGHASYDGVTIEAGGLGALTHNIIRACYGSGIAISGVDSAPVIRGNYICSCGTYGLNITGAARGTYERNVLVRHCRAAVCIAGRSVTGGAGGGGGGVPGDGGTVDIDPFMSQSSCARTKRLVFRGNTIRASTCGVIIERHANALLTENNFSELAQCMIARGSSEVLLLRNTFYHCDDGVSADEEVRIDLYGNAFVAINGYTFHSLNSERVEVSWNVFRDCQVAVLLRRVRGGWCSRNTITKARDCAIYLGSDCRATISQNFIQDSGVGIFCGEVHCRAIVVDNCVRASRSPSLYIMGDGMTQLQCRNNVLLSGLVGMQLSKGNVNITFNLCINCSRGVTVHNIGGGGVNNTASDLKSLEASPTKASPRFDQSVTSATAAPSTSNVCSLAYCYVSCCSQGILADSHSGVNIEHTLLSNNDVGIFLVGSRATGLTVRNCLVLNSACMGVYATKGAKSALASTAFFKNFMNVVIDDGASPSVSRCVLEAAVVFNSYVSGSHSAPRYTSCLFTARAALARAQHGGGAAAGLNRVSEGAGGGGTFAKQKEEMMQLLASTQVAVMAWEKSRKPSNSDIALEEEPQQPRPRTRSRGRKSIMKEKTASVVATTTAAPAAAPAPAAGLTLEDGFFNIPSLWEDLYAEDPILFDTPSTDNNNNEGQQTVFAASSSPSSTVRRSAILWPSNLWEQGVVGGPGGPFLLHRKRTGGTAAAAAGSPAGQSGPDPPLSTAFLCSGVWLDDGAAPVFDMCYFGEHCHVGATGRRNLMPPDAAMPASEVGEGALPPIGSPRTVTFPQSKRKPLKPINLGGSGGGAGGEHTTHAAFSSTMNNFANTHVYVPPLMQNPSSVLGQVLLAGSPCYWRRYSGQSETAYETVCPLLAKASPASPLDLDLRERLGVSGSPTTSQHVQRLNTAVTEHLNGFGVLARTGAGGVFFKCLFGRNIHGGHIASGATTSFRSCTFEGQAKESLVFVDGSAGHVRNCVFRESRAMLISIGGAGTAPIIENSDFWESPFTSILCEFRQCATGLRVSRGQPTIMNCTIASCTKQGLQLSEEGNAMVEECGFLRNAKAITAEGNSGGTVRGNRIFWNTDGIVVTESSGVEFESNFIYDCTNIGVLVKNGSPIFVDNDLFDHRFTTMLVENASGGRLENNRISFPKEDGALVVRAPDAGRIFGTTSNTVRNNYSPPPNSSFKQQSERQQTYHKMENEKEKNSAGYSALRRCLEDIVSFTLLRVSALAARAMSAEPEGLAWMNRDSDTTKDGGGGAEGGGASHDGAKTAHPQHAAEQQQHKAPHSDPKAPPAARAEKGAAADGKNNVVPPIAEEPFRARFDRITPQAHTSAALVGCASQLSATTSVPLTTVQLPPLPGETAAEKEKTPTAASPTASVVGAADSHSHSNRGGTAGPLGADDGVTVSAMAGGGGGWDSATSPMSTRKRGPAVAIERPPAIVTLPVAPKHLIVLYYTKTRLLKVLEALVAGSGSLAHTHSYANLLQRAPMPTLTAAISGDPDVAALLQPAVQASYITETSAAAGQSDSAVVKGETPPPDRRKSSVRKTSKVNGSSSLPGIGTPNEKARGASSVTRNSSSVTASVSGSVLPPVAAKRAAAAPAATGKRKGGAKNKRK